MEARHASPVNFLFPVYKSITRESNKRETLDRLLDLGFAEMGFGRFGSAVPLGEAISLVAFDASVPEVLENLRAARQPSGSREVRAVNEFCVQIRVRRGGDVQLASGYQHYVYRLRCVWFACGLPVRALTAAHNKPETPR